MKILFLSHWFPYPPNNGSKLRIYNLLRGLSETHNVTLISFSENEQLIPPPELIQLCDRVNIVPSKNYNPTSSTALIGLFNKKPRVLVDKYVPEMEQYIRKEIAKGGYDRVIASQWYMADYIDSFEGVPAIFEEVELGIFIQKIAESTNPWQRIRHTLTEKKLRRYLRELLFQFKGCTVVSDIERNLLLNMVPDYKNIDVIPNGVNLADYEDVRKNPQSDTLIFTGSFGYFPNYDAMLWFVNEILPKIINNIPDIHLIITGDHGDRPIQKGGNVTLTGFVDDVRPFVASSWVSIAPVRFGGGTRLKILEAMALKTPIVSTSKGVEGLDVKNGEHLLIADSPDEFADVVISLLRNKEYSQEIAANGYELIRKKYDWKVIMPDMLDLVGRVANV